MARRIGRSVILLDTAALSSSIDRLNTLDQLGVFGAILVPDRLYRGLKRRFVTDRIDLDPCVLHLGHSFGFDFFPELPLVHLRLTSQFLYQLLVVLGEAIPSDAREHENL